jgi:hypothetical protein
VTVVAVDLPRPRRPAIMKDTAFFRIVNTVRDALFGRDDAGLLES